ncbi:MAG: PQQ-binding-like beta-propeller repeat protein [Vicinamibacteria bacterium]|nr:PQQ-binding-like beta-propeller repeat protein [Vicinamibacteria bacterium]
MRARFVVPLCFTLVAGAQDWPRFRGPQGTGVAEGAALPAVFGPAKNLVWRVEVPRGRSSPIVVRDRVFLTALDGDRLATLAFDLATGAPLWRRDVARAHAHDVYVGNDSATPTPASDGESLFVFFPDLGLLAFDLDGQERWRLPLGPFDSFYGLSGSPVVHGDTVALVCDQRKGSFALAVDKRSGAVRWRVARPNAVTEAYATPVVHAPDSGSPQLLVAGARRNDGYDLATGRSLWWVGNLGIYPAGSPVIHGDTMISVATGGETPEYPPFDSFLEQLDSDKDGILSTAEFAKDAEYKDHFGWLDVDGDGRITRPEWDAKRDESVAEAGVVSTAIGGEGDRTASSLRWRYKKSFSYLITPLVYRDAVYLVKGGGIVTTLDPRTGQVFKTGRTPEAIGSYFASPVAGDGKVYLLSEAGQVTVLKADPQWEILAVNALGERVEATPAIAGGRIYIRTERALYSFGLPAAIAAAAAPR